MMNKGQSLFELLIALVVISISLIAVVGLVTNSLGNTTFSKNQTLATRYTQEAVEWVRGERDLDWDTFATKAGSTYCLDALSWANIGPCNSEEVIIGTPFAREVVLTVVGAGGINVDVLVSTKWTDGQGDHDARVTTTFTNWKRNF